MDLSSLTKDNLNILVVDDVGSARKVIIRLLEKIGFKNIDEAPDGEAALRKLRLGSFALVISDRNMPKLSGLELVSQMAGDPSLRAIPTILVTASGGQEDVVTAIQAGVADYIVKPFTFDTLARKIENVFHKSGLLPE